MVAADIAQQPVPGDLVCRIVAVLVLGHPAWSYYLPAASAARLGAQSGEGTTVCAKRLPVLHLPPQVRELQQPPDGLAGADVGGL